MDFLVGVSFWGSVDLVVCLDFYLLRFAIWVFYVVVCFTVWWFCLFATQAEMVGFDVGWNFSGI